MDTIVGRLMNLQSKSRSEPVIREYDYFLVCGFEFTCDGKRSQQPQEVIEMCVLKYNVQSQQIEDKFKTFAKPQHPVNAKLTTFCKMLTCISDRKLQNAPKFEDILLDFDKWMWKQGLFQSRFIFVPHDTFDLSWMVPEQCRAMGYHFPAYFHTWLDLEKLTDEYKNTQVSEKPAKKQITRQNSKTLLKSFGVQHEGRLHSAEDNCMNKVRLIQGMTEKNVNFLSRVWHYREDGEKDSNDDDLEQELDLDPLEEDKTIARFSRAASRTGYSRATSATGFNDPLSGMASGRSTPSRSGRCTPNRGGRTSPAIRGLFSPAPVTSQ